MRPELLRAADAVNTNPLAARADEELRAQPPDAEARRARALWRIDALRELLSTGELEQLAEAGERIAGRRP